MLNLQNHFIGTYAKNLLSDWNVLADCIQKKTAWIKETMQLPKEKSALLSDQQINDAQNGPFQSFFKPHLQAYATISTIETALAITKDDLFKEAEHLNMDKPLGVPESLLNKIDSSTLKQLREQLNTLVKDHYVQWESHVHEWTQMLLQELKKNNLNLSDLEIQDFIANQPVSELNDRLINLKITVPKLSQSAFDFQQYFRLKSMLALQSMLSRTQLPNTEKDVEEQLKRLHASFKTIHKTESKLVKTQEKPLQQLILPVALEPV